MDARLSFRGGPASSHGGACVSVPLWAVKLFLEGAVSRGFFMEDLLARMDVPVGAFNEAQYPVQVLRVASLLRWLSRRLREETICLSARPVPYGTIATVIKQLVYCSTLGEAIALALRLYRLVVPGFPMRMRVSNGLAYLEVRASENLVPVGFQCWMVYCLLTVGRWLVDQAIPLRDAFLIAPQSDPRYQESEPFFEVPTKYGMPTTGVAIEAGWLNRPVVRNSESVPSFVGAMPANLVRASRIRSSTAEQVRHQLISLCHQSGSLPNFEHVGRSLGSSPRSLRRKLQNENCGFQVLKETVLRELAVQWITHSDAPVAEIGTRLGFCDASTFHRAFKRWTGVAPGQFRRSNSVILG